MTSKYQLAKLSEDVYSLSNNSVSVSEGVEKITWVRQERFTVNQIGFSCALYVKKSNEISTKSVEAVLAFRGTNDLIDVFVDDREIASSRIPTQANAAISIANNAKMVYPNLVLTGHSLGGALAIIAGAHTGLKVVTFNAPGVLAGCVRSSYLGLFSNNNKLSAIISTVKVCLSGSNVENIRNNGDVVSSFLLPQVGKTQSLPSKCGTFDIMCKHEIKSIVNSLSN